MPRRGKREPREDFTAVLVELHQKWLSSLDLERVLPEIAAVTQRLLCADEVSLLLVDPNGKELVEHVILSHTRSADERYRIRIRAEGVTGWVAMRRTPLSIPDVRKDSRYVHTSDRIRSEAAVPVLAGDRLLGVLNAESARVRWFTPAKMRLMELLATQIAIALVNAESYDRERRRGRQLLILHHLSRISYGAIPPVAFLRRAADAVRREFGCHYAAVFGADHERGALALLAQSSDRDLDLRLGDEIPFEKGLVGTAFRLGETVSVRDVSRELLYLAKVPDIRSEACVPIRVGERCLGVLDAQSREGEAFTPDDVIFLETMARFVAPTLESFLASRRRE
ncbi:MAG: GAF domain-containing protein [Planctomycetes bacterium]|nr:GAF domain-containing protein [Planctomycetota bacterium]